MLMFLFILFFTSDCFRVCRGKTRVGRKSRMNEGGRAEKKEGRRDTVDGRTLFCIASLMAISMIFFSAENIKSLRYLLQSQSGNDLPGNLHGENFLLLPFLLLLLFFCVTYCLKNLMTICITAAPCHAELSKGLDFL